MNAPQLRYSPPNMFSNKRHIRNAINASVRASEMWQRIAEDAPAIVYIVAGIHESDDDITNHLTMRLDDPDGGITYHLGMIRGGHLSTPQWWKRFDGNDIEASEHAPPARTGQVNPGE
ncbi:hypothetical protein EIP86_003001 [Pleurotus ostreatoroseus]|nr:hypothetical protein EIP86_003001 [Pleurotus ostreatoroseus]